MCVVGRGGGETVCQTERECVERGQLCVCVGVCVCVCVCVCAYMHI